MRVTRVLFVISAGLVFAFFVFVMVYIYQLLVSGCITGKLASLTGLVLQEIKVYGVEHISRDAVVAATGCERGSPMLAVNIRKIKDNIESQMMWVKSATVIRKFPNNSIEIHLEEKIPVAIWRDIHDNHVVIDETGDMIVYYTGSGKFSNLITISGVNANRHFQEIKEIMRVDPSMLDRIAVINRVGDRRWTIVMKSGVEIMLPESGFVDTWRKALEIIGSNDVAHLKTIDMRIVGKVFFAKK